MNDREVSSNPSDSPSDQDPGMRRNEKKEIQPQIFAQKSMVEASSRADECEERKRLVWQQIHRQRLDCDGRHRQRTSPWH